MYIHGVFVIKIRVKMTTSGNSNNECHDGNDMPRLNPAASDLCCGGGNKMKTYVVWEEIRQGVFTDAIFLLWEPISLKSNIQRSSHFIFNKLSFPFFPFSQWVRQGFYIIQGIIRNFISFFWDIGVKFVFFY